jgi:hypothetical protein
MWDLSVSLRCLLYRTLPTGELAGDSKTNAPAACFSANLGLLAQNLCNNMKIHRKVKGGLLNRAGDLY